MAPMQRKSLQFICRVMREADAYFPEPVTWHMHAKNVKVLIPKVSGAGAQVLTL